MENIPAGWLSHYYEVRDQTSLNILFNRILQISPVSTKIIPLLKNSKINRIPGEEKATEIDSDRTCVICLSDIRNHMAFPCKHVITCDVCSKERMDTCPICRGIIVTIEKIYL